MPITPPAKVGSSVPGLAPSPTVPLIEKCKFQFDPSDPMHIHQHALDITGDALEQNDFDTFAAFFRLPHDVDTFKAHQTIRSREHLRTLFQNSRQQNEEMGVTHRIRTSIAAMFKSPDTITCSHVSRIMNGNFQLRDAVPCHSIFENVNGVWLLTRSSYALEETDAPFDRLLTKKGQPLRFSDP